MVSTVLTPLPLGLVLAPAEHCPAECRCILSLQLSWKCYMMLFCANLPLELLTFESHVFSHLTWIPEPWCDTTTLVSPSSLQIIWTFLSFSILFSKCITWKVDVKPERHKPNLQISYLNGNVSTNSVFLLAHMYVSAIFRPFLEFMFWLRKIL